MSLSLFRLGTKLGSERCRDGRSRRVVAASQTSARSEEHGLDDEAANLLSRLERPPGSRSQRGGGSRTDGTEVASPVHVGRSRAPSSRERSQDYSGLIASLVRGGV